MNIIPPREKSISLGTAPIVLDVAAQWVSCIVASETFRLSINDGPDFSFFQGAKIGFPLAEISKLTVSPASGATVNPHAITLLYGVGDFVDSRLALQSGAAIRSTSAATLDGSTGSVGVSSVSNTLLIAANTSRRCVRLTNDSSVSCRLSSVAADLTAGAGEILRAGEAREIFVTGAIYGRAAGVGCTVNVSAENF